jgi:hypothetical protein
MSAARSWAEDYYDAMTHYAWAPDELDHHSDRDRHKGKRPSPYDTVTRLRRLEVAFNHILAIFFCLAPSRFVAELFEAHCGVQDFAPLTHLGRDFERKAEIDSITQPDFVFENDQVFLTVEVNLDSKSSLEQLQKYSYLHCLVREQNLGRQHALLYLTRQSEALLFPGKITSLNQARKFAEQDLRSDHPAKWTVQKMTKVSGVADLLDGTPPWFRIGHCQFADFSTLVRRYGDASVEGSVESRLFGGLFSELERRKLARAPENSAQALSC